jgi:membrane associated rhomboid family serine protease
MIIGAAGGLSLLFDRVLAVLWLAVGISGVLWAVLMAALIRDSFRRHFRQKTSLEDRLEPDVEFLRSMHIRP